MIFDENIYNSCFYSRSIINVDCLLDAVQALVSDCDHAAIRQNKNVDAFVNRCKLVYVFLPPFDQHYRPMIPPIEGIKVS